MSSELIRHTAEIVGAFVAKNEMSAKDVSDMLNDVHGTLARLAGIVADNRSQDSAKGNQEDSSPDASEEAKKEAMNKRVAPIKVEKKRYDPIIPVDEAVRDDAIICLACGKPCKALKGHLTRSHNIDPDEYRRRYGLERDFPMVAPNYSDRRRQLAIDSGLGEKSRATPRKEDA